MRLRGVADIHFVLFLRGILTNVNHRLITVPPRWLMNPDVRA